MILVVSKDEDFSSVIAEQVEQELKLPCRIAKTTEEARKFVDNAALTVSSEPLSRWPGRVLAPASPVHLPALLAEISDSIHSADDTINLGSSYRFSLRQKQLTHKNGESVALTDKEVQLLQGLNKAGKKGIARDALLKAVWGIEGGMDTHTLETHIYRLRAKFRELGDEQAIIAVNGGYAPGWL